MRSHPNRRVLLGGLAAAALIPSARAAGVAGAVPFSGGAEAPRLIVPPGATDCHHHIYDSSFPADPRTSLRPPNASPADYEALRRRLGTSRSVLVTPSTYGTDNRLHLQAMQALGPQRTRMVAVVDTSVTDEALRSMHAAGVRGIRFNLVQAGVTTFDMVEPLAARIAPMGWHIQFHLLGPQIAEKEAMIRGLPVPVVFDHLGRIPQPEGVNSPAYAAVRRLLDGGRAWVKLSGAYMDTKVGAAGNWADTVPIAAGYALAAPERCVWASDWPHVTEGAEKPDDARLLDLLTEWVPDDRVRHRVLVENPSQLYDFPRG
ncbi:putative TIM-barrel fold metal-dependent hydrolase [Humitalea rosea]|uniref:Putative TIM-barrel fold metal-dependent hydrolase n=1 Tax=Humitalea rosea TaxID=990373 RepID=A0A2W7IK69_9PROT|nr:amidohydrolase family protein [Humitalea rosea]PZW38933.1 putative TIM-barrel fold metal-dependent hydrolase [Humitalea rosea]